MALLYIMSTHYTTRGGSSNNSYICGLHTTGLAGAYNYIGLHIGAALSLLHIMPIVVVLLAMVPIVGFSLFMPEIASPLTAGTLALLYHLNHIYTLYSSWWYFCP